VCGHFKIISSPINCFFFNACSCMCLFVSLAMAIGRVFTSLWCCGSIYQRIYFHQYITMVFSSPSVKYYYRTVTAYNFSIAHLQHLGCMHIYPQNYVSLKFPSWWLGILLRQRLGKTCLEIDLSLNHYRILKIL